MLFILFPFSRLSEIQWAAFILLCAGCTTAQLNPRLEQNEFSLELIGLKTAQAVSYSFMTL